MDYAKILQSNTRKLTESDVIDAENALNITFPTDYRNFLLFLNGGEPLQDLMFDWNPGISEESLYLTKFYSLQEFLEAQKMKFDDELFERSIFVIAQTHSPIVICMSFGQADFGTIYTFGWDEGLMVQAKTFDDFVSQLNTIN
jgi:hypothetical protein